MNGGNKGREYTTKDIANIRKGSFPVHSGRFKENSDMAVAEVAYQWVREILREGNISKLVAVTYNGENDITELVEKKLNGWNNDLPF